MHTVGVQVERDEETLAQQLNEDNRQLWCEAMIKLPLLEQVSEENPALRFIHQNWQEYFAGGALAQMPPAQWPEFTASEPEPLEEVRADLGNLDPLPGPPISHWDEAAKFAVQIATGEQRSALLDRLQTQNLALAGRAIAALIPLLQDSEIPAVEQKVLDTARIEQLRAALLQRSRDPAMDVRLRIEFPAGVYTVGSEDGRENKKPPIQIELDTFKVAFATVTNAEYRCFIDADGYQDPRWWPGVAGEWVRGEWRNQELIDWWQERLKALREIIDQYEGDEDRIHAVTELDLFAGVTKAGAETWLNNGKLEVSVADNALEKRYGGDGVPNTEPQEWRSTQYNHAAQPVVGVTVFEAEAYCKWITSIAGRRLCLPTEAQWEAAARGAAARAWPFHSSTGSSVGAEQVNHEPTHLRRAAPAGCFPAGDSEEGLLDMAGNVWEWAATPWSSSLVPEAVVKRAQPDESVPRVLRGGSFNVPAISCRPSYRNSFSPGDRNYFNGFRLFSCPIHEH